MRGIGTTHADSTGPITERAFHQGAIIDISGPNDEVIKCLMPLATSQEDPKKGLPCWRRTSVDKIMQEELVRRLTALSTSGHSYGSTAKAKL